jgi:LysM repeat protein
MDRKIIRTLIITSFAVVALLSAGCTRSVSTQTPEATGVSGSFQQATMEAVLSTFLTQTAQAIEPSNGTPGPTSTSGIAFEPSITPDGSQPAVNVTTTSGTPTATGPIEHVVLAGQWLYSIARMYDVEVQEIRDLNGLTTDAVFPGQVLLIPTDDSITPTPGATTYVVQTGDRVYSIARDFGVTAAAIIEANNLTSPYTLFIGQVLTIP